MAGEYRYQNQNESEETTQTVSTTQEVKPNGHAGGDISFFTEELDVAECTIIDERSGEPVKGSDGQPFKIYLAGPNNKQSLDANARYVRTVTRLRTAHRSTVDGPPAEAMQQANTRLCIDRVIGWSPITFKGQPFPYSRENAEMLLSKSRTLLGQVSAFLGNEANFLPKSAS